MDRRKEKASIFLLLLIISDLTYCHIRLTYPPARYPALDFLDTVRTTGPCGVPKPENGTGFNCLHLSIHLSISIHRRAHDPPARQPVERLLVHVLPASGRVYDRTTGSERSGPDAIGAQ